MDIRPVEICPFGPSPNWIFLVPTAMSLRERISACVFSHHKAWRRWCYGVGLLCWWHGHSILQPYAIPSGLGLVGLSFCFNRTMTQHNSRLFKGYFNNTESDWVLHQMTWLPQSSTKLRWFGMSWTAEWRESSQQVLTICGNSRLGKAFQVKLVERMPSVQSCQSKGWLFEIYI